MSSGQPWTHLTAAELSTLARNLRRLADELALEARRRKQAEREAHEEARREICAELREAWIAAHPEPSHD